MLRRLLKTDFYTISIRLKTFGFFFNHFTWSPINSGLRISEEELDSILDNLDRNKDGLISKREFLKIFLAGQSSTWWCVTWSVTSCHVVCDVMSRGVWRHITWIFTSRHVVFWCCWVSYEQKNSGKIFNSSRKVKAVDLQSPTLRIKTPIWNDEPIRPGY